MRKGSQNHESTHRQRKRETKTNAKSIMSPAFVIPIYLPRCNFHKNLTRSSRTHTHAHAHSAHECVFTPSIYAHGRSHESTRVYARHPPDTYA